MSWRQHMQLHWRGQGFSTKVASLHTAANPEADLGTASDIVDASRALSVAGLQAVQLIPSVIIADDPGTGPYPSAFDYVKIQMRSAAGELVDYHVPAPVGGIFTGSGLSAVDPTNPLVIALVDALIGAGSSSSGSPLVEFVTGGRYRIANRGAF
jgi:hypothetical protein